MKSQEFVNDKSMTKIIDVFTLTLTIFLLSIVWTGRYLNVGLALLLSSTLTALTVITTIYLKKQNSKPYDKDRLALELSVRGNEYLVEILKSILKNAVFESGSNWILLENALIIVCFRFSLVGLNDVGNFYSLSLKKNRNQVFLLCRGIDRKAMHVLEMHDVKINVVKTKGIYDFLRRNSALPALEKEKKNFSLKAVAYSILSRSNTKSYLFSGIVLMTTSFITPLKIYYLIFGTIALILAILTLTPLGNGEFGTNGSFNALIQETEKFNLSENSDCDQCTAENDNHQKTNKENSQNTTDNHNHHDTNQ